jgi:nitroreductase
MDFQELLEKRRAYRSLDKVQITEGMVKELAKAAQLAPSCFNNQPWRYVFVYGDEALDKMYETLSEGNRWAKEASLIIVVLSKKDYDCIMKDGRVYYHFDAGMSAAMMILKATDMGLVAHPIAGYDPALIRKALNIPDDIEVVNIIIVGKHASDIKPWLKEKQVADEQRRPDRKRLEEFVFIDKYQ